MSRNIRKKMATASSKKAPKRRRDSNTSSSSFDLSSNSDGYSGVEDISDSEDNDDEDVTTVEGKYIEIDEALPRPSDSPRPPVFAEEEADDEDEEDDDDEDDDDDADVDQDDNISWQGVPSEVEESQVSDFYNEATAFSSDNVERHVRFDIPDESEDSDSTDTDEEQPYASMFPDIFVSQNALDPAFRREIEHDPDDSSGSGSFWDYQGQYVYNDDEFETDTEEIPRQLMDDDTPVATPAPVAPEPTFEEPQDLDGYETDGDTTEEDIPEPPPRRKTRRPSVSASEDSDSDCGVPIKSQRGQPRIGRFSLDRADKKPIAVLNPVTRKMMIFTPHKRRQFELSPEQFNFPFPTEDLQASPIFSNSANLMLSAMFSSNTFADFINNPQPVGPAEAFFPFASDANNLDDSSTGPSVQGDDDDAEKNIDLDAFVTWDDSGSSGDENDEMTPAPASTPARPTTASSDHDMFSHLKPETVGAFRRNQIDRQLILSNQATQDSLAFSGPYNHTAIRGLKTDRFDTATAPLTPLRRHRKQMNELAKSPLERVSERLSMSSTKRKASGDATAGNNGHKRHRSISDVNYLQI